MSLYSVILFNNYDVIKVYLEMKIDINEILEENNNFYGLSLLGVVCYILDLKSVELFLKNGVDLNLKNNDGEIVFVNWFKWNGLIYFLIEKVREDIVNKMMSLLLEYGLNINDIIDN